MVESDQSDDFDSDVVRKIHQLAEEAADARAEIRSYLRGCEVTQAGEKAARACSLDSFRVVVGYDTDTVSEGDVVGFEFFGEPNKPPKVVEKSKYGTRSEYVDHADDNALASAVKFIQSDWFQNTLLDDVKEESGSIRDAIEAIDD